MLKKDCIPSSETLHLELCFLFWIVFFDSSCFTFPISPGEYHCYSVFIIAVMLSPSYSHHIIINIIYLLNVLRNIHHVTIVTMIVHIH